MRRITVDRFVAAVKKTGVIPARCLWVQQRGKKIAACGIGTLAVEAGRGKDYAHYARAADGLGLSSEYITGYITGFDGHCSTPQGAEYEAGYEDGRACAIAVFDQRLHERYEVVSGADLTPYLDTPWGDDDDGAHVYTRSW
jgi:hypothetical protein